MQKLTRGPGVLNFEHASKGKSSDKARKKKGSPVLQLSTDNGGNITFPPASDIPIGSQSSIITYEVVLGDPSSVKESTTYLFDGDSAILLDKDMFDISTQPDSSEVSDREVGIRANVPHDNLFPLDSDVHGFVDIIDMSVHSFQGYHCILCIVDPVICYGFTVVFCNNMVEELNRGFDHLLTLIYV